jgi:uncharacterized protein (TIGR00255 family)
MTGFGEAHQRVEGVAVAVEVRTINNRYLKVVIKSAEGYSLLEPEIESVVRDQIKRGTVQVSVRVDHPRSVEDYRLNLGVLQNYRQQLEALAKEAGFKEAVPLASLLLLPGVVNDDPIGSFDAMDDWPLVSQTLRLALANLQKMRTDEGRAMQADLHANCRQIGVDLEAIAAQAPQVVDNYRTRLEERVKKALDEYQVTLNTADLLREVSIYAERTDISEEIVRLRSHLEQFDTIVALPESSGRKLEFLTQEMFREANTIGSKCNDVQISRHVIEIKAAIERIREMIQNVE